VPANTGAAGARHRVACFAGKPAPTMNRTGFSNFEKDSCTCIKRVEGGSGAWAGNKKAHLAVNLLSTAYGAAPGVERLYIHMINKLFIVRGIRFYL